MGAREFMHALQDEGFVVMAEGGRLLVGPSTRLTDEHRRQIRLFKRDLLEVAPYRHWLVTMPGRKVGFTCPQGITRAEVLQQYPGALDAEPMSCN